MPVGETGEAMQDEQGFREKPPRKDIKVVVAIAMPCRPRRTSSLPRRDQDVRMSYSIGVHAIPWNGEVYLVLYWLLDCGPDVSFLGLVRTSGAYEYE